MRILLVSDVHLDAPFAWAKPEIARRRRQALRDALARSIRLAADERVDLICCGGDLFEHDRVSADTGQFLRTLFESVYPTPVYISPGNHDWLGPESCYEHVKWSLNVHLFRSRRLEPVSISEGFTLWGAAHHTPAGTPDFLTGFHVDRGGIHLALFHGSEQGAFAAEGPDKMPHAPFRAAEIEKSGLHFAMLGHYHSPRDEARFTYPGNPEPLTFGESGNRGAVIVTMAGDGSVTLDRRRVAVTDVADLDVDVTGCISKQEIRARVADVLVNRRGYARVQLSGELGADIDVQALDFDDLTVGLDASPLVRFGAYSVAYNLAEISHEPTVRGQFIQDVQASGLPVDERQRIIITGLRALDGRTDLKVI